MARFFKDEEEDEDLLPTEEEQDQEQPVPGPLSQIQQKEKISFMPQAEEKPKQPAAPKEEAVALGKSALEGEDGMAGKRAEKYLLKASTLPAEDQAYFNDKFNELRERAADARRNYYENKNRTEWLQVAEKFGQALTQLGAAAQGMKTGVDMSGLKFDKTDWDQNYNRLLKEMDMDMDNIRGERKELGARQAGLERISATEQGRKAAAAERQARQDELNKREGERQKSRDALERYRQSQMNKRLADSIAARGADKEAARAEKEQAKADKSAADLQQVAERAKLAAQKLATGELSRGVDKRATEKQLEKDMLKLGYSQEEITKLKEKQGGFLGFGSKTDYEKILNDIDARADRKPTAEGKADGQVIVEKDGKQFKLPASQLSEAMKQGYKQVK